MNSAVACDQEKRNVQVKFGSGKKTQTKDFHFDKGRVVVGLWWVGYLGGGDLAPAGLFTL